MIIEPPIELDSTALGNAQKQFIRILEKYISLYPSHWEFWEEFEEGNLVVARPITQLKSHFRET